MESESAKRKKMHEDAKDEVKKIQESVIVSSSDAKSTSRSRSSDKLLPMTQYQLVV